ncbi:MAG: glycosyltransferase family 1 protein [Proteobacteria bacterium]|nr:glycosyltransferase family 1 protein [Pseudomonadota bacterium]
MRIAIFTEVFLPKIDGITNRLRHTVARLVAQGHEVLVFAPDTAVAEHAGARVVRIPSAPFKPYPGVRIAAPDPRIAWELARFGPDVVHAVGPAILGLWGLVAAAALRLPRVASYHTDFPRYLPGYGLDWVEAGIWPLIRNVHNLAHVNLCPSRFTRSELSAHGVHDVGIWRGGVDTDLFHPSRRSLDMRMRLSGGRPDGPVLLSVGRLSPEKNLSLFTSVLDALPDVRVALVGDGPARRDLEREFGARRVAFLGFLQGEELAEAFASADAFVMPSRTETLGFVVLEAMAAGCPVVAANAGGVPDLVRHGETGLLFDPDRPQEAIDAISRLLERRGERTYLADLGRKAARESSWEAETRGLVQNYRKAVVLGSQRGIAGRMARVVWG